MPAEATDDDELDALLADPLPSDADHRPPVTRTPDVTRSPRGVGRWFQPLPGGLLPESVPGANPDRPAALLVAAPGCAVHALTAMTVTGFVGAGGLLSATGAGLRVTLLPDGGVTWYRLPGDEVEAGAVVGRFDAASGTLSRLVVSVTDDTGAPVDAVRLLTGLPDPAELGTIRRGVTVPPDEESRDCDGLLDDPYEHDIELARLPMRQRR